MTDKTIRTRRKLGWRLCACERLEDRRMLAADFSITEFMADNEESLLDRDGDASDWIEIRNIGDAAGELTGYYLTDEVADLDRWQFPLTSLERGEAIVVFASGKNVRVGNELHTNFRLDRDGEYLGLIGPDGQTVVDDFGPSYPPQRRDVSYGVGQRAQTKELVTHTSAAKILVPSSDHIGETWRGQAEPFNDDSWASVSAAVGYGGRSESILINVAEGKPTSTNGTLWTGFRVASLTDGNTGTIVHGDGAGGNTGRREADGFRYDVNLEGDFELTQINVFPRQDGCCPNRLTNYRVSVHRDDDGQLGDQVWSADVRTDGSFPSAGPTPPDELVAESGQGEFTGQWVRITSLETPVPQYALQISEIEVLVSRTVAASSENIATEAAATASGPVWNGFPPSNIIDGNPGTISHPASPVRTFDYTIDLGRDELLEEVTVRGRGDGCCTDRLTNYRVTLLADDNGQPGVANWSADIRADGSNSGVGGVDVVTPDLDATGSFEGRFVHIEKIDEGRTNYWPQIAEVEIFSSAGYVGHFETDVEDQLLGRNASAYLRIPFSVDQDLKPHELRLEMLYDDGFAAFLNGVEIVRQNTPVNLRFDSEAPNERNAHTTQSFLIPPDRIRAGNNVLAIHGLNATPDDPDFLIAPQLAATSAMSSERGYLLEPTPGEFNVDSVEGFVGPAEISVERGFYANSFGVEVTSDTVGATLIYTTDGSVPTLDNGSAVFLGDDVSPATEITIDSTTTLRVTAVKERFEPAPIETRSYIFPQQVIRQPAAPEGLPEFWDGISQPRIRADYEVDPEVVDDPAYRDEIVDGLTSIPTISIVMDPDDLFGQENGIYINSGQRGREWERPTSVEIIEPDGSSFQADSGVRIHGFSWRFHQNTPKHSLRLEFRDEYGPTKLEYPLFPDAGVDRFDSIVLRAQGGRSWGGTQFPEDSQYLRDTFARDLAHEMGAFDGHATLVHLYLNGLYWGLYNPVERPNADMGAEYFGGSEEDYDALNRRTSTMEVIDGDLQRYDQMIDVAERALSAGVTTDEDYAELQKFVAIDDFIDWMIRNQYVTNRDGLTAFDGNNQRAIGSRVGDPQFRFFVWDMEYSLWSATDNNNIAPRMNQPALAGNQAPPRHAWSVYNALRQHPEFRVRFADHVQKHFFNDGALTPGKAAATYDTRAESIETAIIAESARWGDAKRRRPYTRDVEWQTERDRLLNEYFPRRSDILVSQYRDVQLFPEVAAPDFRINGDHKHGGKIVPGDGLSFFQQSDVVATDVPIVTSDHAVSVHVPTDDHLSNSWRGVSFVEGAAGESWIHGRNGVGFDSAPTYDDAISMDIEQEMLGVSTSVYVRMPFQIDDISAIQSLDRLQLRMLVDDGFAAYLNGVRIAQLRAPGENQLTWESVATANGEADLNDPTVFDITRFKDEITIGTNVLAIHGLNRRRTSPDMLIHAELVGQTLQLVQGTDDIWFTTDGSDPRLPGGAIHNAQQGGTARLYEPGASTPLVGTTQVRARAIDANGAWSALNEAVYQADNQLVISEIHFNPAEPTPAELSLVLDADNDDFEFIELLNTGESEINLSNWKLAGGINAELSSITVAPNERVVVVRDLDAFAARYGDGVRVIGAYDGRLANNGEEILVCDPSGAVVLTVEYGDSDPWYPRTDGVGASLELRDPQSPASEAFARHSGWRASTEYGGSPGVAGVGPTSIVISEILSHSATRPDAIELQNTSNASVNIGGWFLSDASNNLMKFQIPADTLIEAGEFMVFDESDLSKSSDPAVNNFAISSHGDDIWLTSTTNGSVRFEADVHFSGAPEGESFGRTSETERVLPLQSLTLGFDNSAARIGPVIISEINFNPSTPGPDAMAIDPSIESGDLEFIELLNTSDRIIDLEGWRIRRGISLGFASGAQIRPGEAIVLARNETVSSEVTLTAFRSHYGLAADIAIYGFDGRLDNSGELVHLLRSGHEEDNETAYYLEDEVYYDQAWHAATNGSGETLHRSSSSVVGSNRNGWLSAEASPGRVDLNIKGDFNNDGFVNEVDIDMLFAQLRSNEVDLRVDLTDDSQVDEEDRNELVVNIIGTTFGDANLDGVFNSDDLISVLTFGEYEDATVGNLSWSAGDWDGDGNFTTEDLVLAFQLGQYSAE